MDIDERLGEYGRVNEKGNQHPCLFLWSEVAAILDHEMTNVSRPLAVVLLKSGHQLLIYEEYNDVCTAWKSWLEDNPPG